MIWLLLFVAQSGAASRGEKIFAQSCSVGYCHGAAGAAARGPRLRGRTFTSDYLYKVTRDGVPRSAMPAWKDRLKDDEIRDVVAYIMSLSSATGDPAPAPIAAPGPSESHKPSRGQQLFADRCGSCHPALVKLAGQTSLPTAARQAKTIKLKDGDTFPALPISHDDAFVTVYDLTAPPPVKRTLERAEVVSITAADWKHPQFEAEELKEIFASIMK